MRRSLGWLALGLFALCPAALYADGTAKAPGAPTCSTHGTSVHFYSTPSEAAEQAKKDEKFAPVVDVVVGEDGQGDRHRVSGAPLDVLLDELDEQAGRALLVEGLGDLLGGVAHHDHGPLDLEADQGVEDVEDHGPAAQAVQGLGQRRAHARPLPSGKHDGGQGALGHETPFYQAATPVGAQAPGTVHRLPSGPSHSPRATSPNCTMRRWARIVYRRSGSGELGALAAVPQSSGQPSEGAQHE